MSSWKLQSNLFRFLYCCLNIPSTSPLTSQCCLFSNAMTRCWPWWDWWPGDQAGSAHSRCSSLCACKSGKHLRIPECLSELGKPGKPKICAEGEQRTLPTCLGVQSLSVSKPLCRKVGATEIRDCVRSRLSPQFCPASNLHRVWRSSGDQTVCCCELALSVSAVNLGWLGFQFTAEGRATDHPAFHNPRTNFGPA